MRRSGTFDKVEGIGTEQDHAFVIDRARRPLTKLKAITPQWVSSRMSSFSVVVPCQRPLFIIMINALVVDGPLKTIHFTGNPQTPPTAPIDGIPTKVVPPSLPQRILERTRSL
jgi:hypothetical protein